MKPYIKPIIACVFLVGAVLTWQQSEKSGRSSRPDWKKISPFTAVTFEGETIFAEHESAVYELVSIEGIMSPDLVKVAKKCFGHEWQKRIREDIAEVLAEAGAADVSHVDLELKELESGNIIKAEDVEMTSEKRQKAYGTT